MEMNPITGSTAITAWGHDEATGELAVTMTSGKTLRYANVPAEVANGFAEAESAGKYFGSAVKGRFDLVKDEEEGGNS
jgi:hypothetical protein